MKKLIVPFLALSLLAPAFTLGQLTANIDDAAGTTPSPKVLKAYNEIQLLIDQEVARLENQSGSGALVTDKKDFLEHRMLKLEKKKLKERMKKASKEEIRSAREALTKAARFSDIMAHRHAAAVAFLEKAGVIGGYADGTFRPDNTLNRAELAKILVEGNGITPTLEEFKECFPDVQQEWFAPYVCYAKAQGWVSGYPDGTFQPAKVVLKVEALKMLANAYGLSSEELMDGTYSDVDTKAWYAPFLGMAHKRNLVEETAGNFEPTREMTRGMVSESLFRTIALRLAQLERFDDSSYAVAEDLADAYTEEDTMEMPTEDASQETGTGATAQ